MRTSTLAVFRLLNQIFVLGGNVCFLISEHCSAQWCCCWLGAQSFKGYLKVNMHQFQNPQWASFLPPMYAVCHLNGGRKALTSGAVFLCWTKTSPALSESEPLQTQSLVFWVVFCTHSAVISFSCCISSRHACEKSCLSVELCVCGLVSYWQILQLPLISYLDTGLASCLGLIWTWHLLCHNIHLWGRVGQSWKYHPPKFHWLIISGAILLQNFSRGFVNFQIIFYQTLLVDHFQCWLLDQICFLWRKLICKGN